MSRLPEGHPPAGSSSDLRPTTYDSAWFIHRYDSVASTMDVGSQLAWFGARDRTAVVSLEQTAGRGRAGRSWKSPAGSTVFATLILRPPVATHRLSTLPLVAGVAVAEAIERIACGCAVRLKWPNDVWVDMNGSAAKVAGVLVTSSLRGETVDHVLVGIGINVRGETQELPPGATTIEAATGVDVTPDQVLGALLGTFANAYVEFAATHGRPSLAGWLARAALLGETVTVEDAGRSRTGTYVGIDEDGGLLIAEPGQPVRKIIAGDLVRGPRPVGQSG